MNKKISIGVVIGLLAIAILATSAITTSVLNKQYNKILNGLPDKLERYDMLNELDEVIKNNYYSGGDALSLKTSLGKGYISSLNDEFARFMNSEEYEEYMGEIEGDMPGIGIEYSKISNSAIEVTQVFDDSPAQNSGLSVGDRIIAFDGITLDANNYNELVSRLEGGKVSSVNITYKRDNVDTTVNIIKGYEAKSVVSKVQGNIGYIKISNFYETTKGQVESCVQSLQNSGVAGFVLDLRNNKSTNYAYAMDVLDIFVPVNESDAPAATVVDSNNNVMQKFSTIAGEVNLPTAVLVNGGTSAAGELFACNIRDFSKAQLVGTKTKGVALMPKAFKLSEGNAVLLSVGIVLPYKSQSFNKVGIIPDVEAQLSERTKNLASDSQFVAAASLIVPQE